MLPQGVLEMVPGTKNRIPIAGTSTAQASRKTNQESPVRGCAGPCGASALAASCPGVGCGVQRHSMITNRADLDISWLRKVVPSARFVARESIGYRELGTHHGKWSGSADRPVDSPAAQLAETDVTHPSVEAVRDWAVRARIGAEL